MSWKKIEKYNIDKKKFTHLKFFKFNEQFFFIQFFSQHESSIRKIFDTFKMIFLFYNTKYKTYMNFSFYNFESMLLNSSVQAVKKIKNIN